MSDDGFFEAFYAEAGEDFERIPWARLAPRPQLVEWLDRHPPAPGTRALVVACGLGDDAEELARRGCAVDAFDISPTAIAAARRRFPDSAVAYRVADLFDLPEDWRGAFGVVVEVMTVQSLPEDLHAGAIDVITGCVAAGGTLLVRALTRAEDQPWDQRPWPLKPSELARFEAGGLERVAACSEDGFLHAAFARR
jgi:SAM-dependent methyltransferase